MVRFLDNMRHDHKVYWASWRKQFKAAWVLRGAFALQVFGMTVNNIGLLIAWWFMFDRFGTINGWSGAELIGVQGVNMVIFGLAVMLCSGFFELPRYVDTGIFDTFLTKPAGVLPQVSSSTIEIASLGDLLLGVVLVVWYSWYTQADFITIAMFLLAMAIGVLLMWCFVTLPFLISFYLFDSERVSRSIMFFYLDTGIYPSGVLSGGVRIFLLTAFPGLFIGAIPLDVLRGVGWELLFVGVVVALCWTAATLWFLKRAVVRYESANLVGAR